ncbi:elongation of very long chain fatty acids protein 1-like isoform X1 [Neodiprion virginianus]|uniref:elongation of very long chain fatty acids protein 1-like isoform X1 n=2 Tax=Neodiprion virginianus TaxID=2961670 RepID=UPI001EE6C5B6|nr:elongation of very long chain fatty acids protein 1-like isoform X1 [Neodiprion virginianus]
MAAIIRALLNGYHTFNVELADPRTQSWFLIGSPWPILGLMFCYIHFVLSLGPRLMKDRKPFNLDRVMQIYNVVQILVSAYLLYKALTLAWLWEYSYVCEPVDYSKTPKAIEIAATVWLYFIVKLIDLLDTVFFVLRKKQSQISFLHVYHHAGMVIGTWAGVKFLPGGHGTFLGVVNSFVHIIMYSHYLVTSMKSSKPWWKKHITQLQLIQFVIILFHFLQLMWVKDCGYPRWTALIFVPQNLFMIVLFGDFYYKTYVKKPAAKKHPEQNGVSKKKSIPNDKFN